MRVYNAKNMENIKTNIEMRKHGDQETQRSMDEQKNG